MCEQARLTLPAETFAAGAARRFAADRCRGWGLQLLCEDVVLTVSELVTNAVLHAASSTTVTMSLTGECLEVAVRDDSPRPPVVRPPRRDLEADIELLIARAVEDPPDPYAPAWQVGESGSIAAGRGMLIVDAIADEWGVTQRSDGKEVWFRLASPTESSVESCRCSAGSATSPGGLRLWLYAGLPTPAGNGVRPRRPR